MLDEVKEFFKYHDLTRLFPNYFNTHTKFLITFAVFLSLALIGISIYLDGAINYHIECPCGSVSDCENPLYSPFCSSPYCDVEYLSPCESVGHVPSFFTQHLGMYLFFVFVYAFVINDLIYRWSEWRKHKRS